MQCTTRQPGCVINNVLVGESNQLFLFEGNYNQFSYLSNQEFVSATSKANFLDNLRRRRRFAEERNLQYLHIIIPCKPLVVRSKTPEPYRQNIRSLFLHSYAPLFTNRDPLQEWTLYPLASLIREQTQRDCYWANDTHINAAGQLCIYREIGKHIPDLSTTFPLLRITEEPRQGDLGLMLGDSEPLPSLCFPWTGELLNYSNTQALPGNTGDIVITHNPLSSTQRRLVLFGDSFIKTMLHLFAHDFRTILYVRGPYFQPDMIELFDPDVLITSETERYLAGVDHDNNGPSLLFESFRERSDYKPSQDFQSALSAQLSYRSHPRITQHWEAEQTCLHSFSIIGIGKAIHNRDIQQCDESGRNFEAVGPVPVIHIHKLHHQPQGDLVIELDSEIESQLKLTVLRNSPDMSAPLEIHQHPVRSGLQQIILPIDHSQAIDGLLLQPLHHPGRFTLQEIQWQ